MAKDLDTAERHLVSVLNFKGKPIEAAWFKFSEFKSTNVCMAYDGYQGIGLRILRDIPHGASAIEPVAILRETGTFGTLTSIATIRGLL